MAGGQPCFEFNINLCSETFECRQDEGEICKDIGSFWVSFRSYLVEVISGELVSDSVHDGNCTLTQNLTSISCRKKHK